MALYEREFFLKFFKIQHCCSSIIQKNQLSGFALEVGSGRDRDGGFVVVPFVLDPPIAARPRYPCWVLWERCRNSKGDGDAKLELEEASTATVPLVLNPWKPRNPWVPNHRLSWILPTHRLSLTMYRPGSERPS